MLMVWSCPVRNQGTTCVHGDDGRCKSVSTAVSARPPRCCFLLFFKKKKTRASSHNQDVRIQDLDSQIKTKSFFIECKTALGKIFRVRPSLKPLENRELCRLNVRNNNV